ncbi:hypothetical protein ABIB18_001539 [Pantoea sp. UYEF8]
MGARQSLSVLHMFSTVPGLGISQAPDSRSRERVSISKFYRPDKVGVPPDAALAKVSELQHKFRMCPNK